MLGNHAKPTSMTLDNMKYPNKRKQVYFHSYIRIASKKIIDPSDLF